MTTHTNKKPLVIERIYTTSGTKPLKGLKTDKVAGIVIDGEIYWIKQAFDRLVCLARAMSVVGVCLDQKHYKWGLICSDGKAVADHPITKLTKHHNVIFNILAQNRPAF